MGRIVARRPVVRIDLDSGLRRRPDSLAVEEPLELRVNGATLAVTMRTPGDDVDLAHGFLVSEGVIVHGEDVRGAIHCGGPGTGGEENTYNVLDVTLAAGVAPPAPERTRALMTTSACGLCGAAQRRQQVHLARGEEAVAQLPVGGQAQPVAVAAERRRDRGDDPDLVRAVAPAGCRSARTTGSAGSGGADQNTVAWAS